MNIKGTTEFPKIYRIGTADVEAILTTPVEVTEKIDGSQFGFGIINDELVCRSKGGHLTLDKCNGLFQGAVTHVYTNKDKLTPGWFYYGEAVEKPRHNKLAYDRVPKGHIALFGIKKADGTFVDDYDELKAEADKLGIDVVPLLFKGTIDEDGLDKIVSETKSMLGGAIEGVVIKNYTLRSSHAPITVGKLVTDEFKEVMRERKPKGTGKDLESKLNTLFACFATEARWDKAIRHLEERGDLNFDASDIGPLIRELQTDVLAEEFEFIKNEIWGIVRKDFIRVLTRGFAEHYFKRLSERTKEGA